MNIIERLERLESAHRALAARHEALMVISRMFLPFINVSPSSKQQLTTKAYDVINELMEAHGHDIEYQELVREAIDELSKTILIVD